MPPGEPQTLDADRLRRHQRHSEKSHHHQHTTVMAHTSMLETASMAGDGATTDDDDAVSLAYLSVTQNSPSDVSSINNYYPSTDDQFDAKYYDGEDHRTRHASSAHGRRSKRSSLSSLRYAGAHYDGGDDGVNMFARAHLGLLINFAAVGTVHGIFQTFAYPFLKIYLNMDEYQAYSAERWMALPWMFKVVLAFVSETVLIPLSEKQQQQQQQHHRRKLYLLLGWIWCLVFALIIVLLPSEKPYFDGSSGQVVNENAASAGGKYVWLFTLASIGYVLVDAVCDGLMVQLASSGGIPGGHDRNSNNQLVVVTTLQATKCGAQMVSIFVLALLCNSDAYGGSFAWSPSIRGVFLLVTLVCVGAIACTWFFVDVQEEEEEPEHDQDELAQDDDNQDDEKDHKGGLLIALLTTARVLWRFLHQRDVLRAIVFTFVTRVGFSYYASTSSKAVYEFYLDVSPLSSNLFSAINVSIYGAVAIGFRNSLLLQTPSWRRIMVVAAGSSIFTTLVVVLFTVFNVVRSPFLTLAFEQLTSGFEALAYYVVLFYVVQIVCCCTSTSYTPDTTAPAEAMTRTYTTTTRIGLESSKYNLVLAVGNLGVPFAVSLSQSVGAHFDAFDDEYTQDTSHARAQVMYCILVAFVVKLASLAALPLLPLRGSCLLATQTTTSTTSDLKLQQEQVTGGGGLHKKAPALVVGGVTGFLLFWATLMVLLASFETTACLTVAGGEGC